MQEVRYYICIDKTKNIFRPPKDTNTDYTETSYSIYFILNILPELRAARARWNKTVTTYITALLANYK